MPECIKTLFVVIRFKLIAYICFPFLIIEGHKGHKPRALFLYSKNINKILYFTHLISKIFH